MFSKPFEDGSCKAWHKLKHILYRSKAERAMHGRNKGIYEATGGQGWLVVGCWLLVGWLLLLLLLLLLFLLLLLLFVDLS